MVFIIVVNAKIVLQKALSFTVNPNSFIFNGKPTDKYFGASVKGKSLKKVISTKNQITIRLQGIDAPELHYKMFGSYTSNLPKNFTQPLNDTQKENLKKLNIEYRQHFGETATVKLYEFLNISNNNSNILSCEFISNNIEKPADVIDTYGRFVGDIFIKIKEKHTNINYWLLANGWVFPAIYNSMLMEEINTVISLSKQGRSKKQNDIYSKFNPQQINKFIDFKLTTRKKLKNSITPLIQTEKGKVINPKLFRRLAVYSIFKKAGVNVGKNFTDYLANKSDKGLYFVSDFINNENHQLKNKNLLQPIFLKKLNEQIINNVFQLQPEEIIFIEDESKLMDVNNKEIISF